MFFGETYILNMCSLKAFSHGTSAIDLRIAKFVYKILWMTRVPGGYRKQMLSS